MIYAIATRCSGGWLAAATGDSSAPSGCTPVAGTGNRYCCPEATARTLAGGSSLPTEGSTAPAAETTTTGGKETGSGGANDPWQEMIDGAVDAGVREGAGGNPPPPPSSWLSDNWQWVAVGGALAVVTTVLLATAFLPEEQV